MQACAPLSVAVVIAKANQPHARLTGLMIFLLTLQVPVLLMNFKPHHLVNHSSSNIYFQ